jgi:hypothetical protein
MKAGQRLWAMGNGKITAKRQRQRRGYRGEAIGHSKWEQNEVKRNGKRKKEQESGKKKEKILARSARKFQMSAKWKTKIRGQDNERKELRIAVG